MCDPNGKSRAFECFFFGAFRVAFPCSLSIGGNLSSAGFEFGGSPFVPVASS